MDGTQKRSTNLLPRCCHSTLPGGTDLLVKMLLSIMPGKTISLGERKG